MNNKTGPWLALGIAAVVIGADQLLKLAVTERLGPGASSRRWEFAGRFLAIEYVENTGAAFGIMRGQRGVLVFAAVLAVVLLVSALVRRAVTSRMVAIGLGLVLGGALGNLSDRVRLDYVIDYIAVGEWPKFNLADCAISVGLVLLGWYSLREPRGEEGAATHVTDVRPSVPDGKERNA